MRGEIDIATSPQLKLALDKAIRESRRRVGTSTLCEVEFLDSSGLNPRAACASGTRPRSAPASAWCVRRDPFDEVMEIAGVDDI